MRSTLALLFAAACLSARVITGSGSLMPAGISTATLSQGDTLILNGPCYVDSGKTLVLQAGVLVQAKTFQIIDEEAEEHSPISALIVARGGKLVVLGTQEKPVIFTSELDKLDTIGIPVATMAQHKWGLWGGVVVCGAATTNYASESARYMSLPDADPAKVRFGGSRDDDSSGVLRYLSIRYAGTRPSVSFENFAGDAIQAAALALCGVGKRTVVEHVEVFRSLDDGFRLIGGTVNTRYLASLIVRDNCFDIHGGYRGVGQFWFGLPDNITGASGIAALSVSDLAARRSAVPHNRLYLANATLVGSSENRASVQYRLNSAGCFLNSIVDNLTAFQVDAHTTSSPNSYERIVAGELTIKGNLLWKAEPVNWDRLVQANADFILTLRDYNELADAEFAGTAAGSMTLGPRGAIDLHPRSETVWNRESFSNVREITLPQGDSLQCVSYRGAFNPSVGAMWIRGWTAFDLHRWISRQDSATVAQLPEPSCPPKDPTRAFRHNRTISRSFSTITRHVSGFMVNVSLDNAQQVSVRLYSATGACVRSVPARSYASGNHRIMVDTRNLARGMYVVRVTAGDHVQTMALNVTW